MSSTISLRQSTPLHIIVALMLLSLSSCVTDYTPKGAEEISGLLVVDGYITNGESIITLRKSLKMTSPMYEEETIDNATLNVECNDGTIMQGEFIEKGKYIVQTGDLSPDKEYRLNFSFDGEIYQSDYLSPIMTTEIDSLSYTKKGQGEAVYICVSAHDSQEKPYYRWTYSETWEVKAPFFANAYEGPGGFIIFFDLRSPNNIYYCWGAKESKVFLLESTERLSENIIHQKRLIEIPCDHDKLSILYHVSVNQMQIRQEAYEYFSILRNTAERTGGLFSPILSAGMEGNIHCLTNHDTPVIGYMEVTTTSTAAMYVDDRSLYEPPPMDCKVIDKKNDSYPWYHYDEDRAEKRCVDCRTKENASKDKPEWWPTSHL